MPQLFKLSEEFSEADEIQFVPLTAFALLVINRSDCVIEMNDTVMEEEYQRFIPTDMLRIHLKEKNKSIFVLIVSLEKNIQDTLHLKQA